MRTSDVERCIAHVDMDAFYAAVEQRDRPELRGVPVVVGGSGTRGVIAAASYEARRFGIRSAMPSAQARRRCPQTVFLRPRMAHYKSVSREIFRVFGEFTPEIEGLSLDEAYLDLTGNLAHSPSVQALAVRIKDRIREQTGLSASVGVGPNKLVAKIASDLDKPDGLCILFGEQIGQVLDPLHPSVIPGIGPRTSARLDGLGIRSLRDLRTAPDALLQEVFGRYSHRVREKAEGIDDRPVSARDRDQSISAEKTFDGDIGDPRQLHARLSGLAGRVAARMRSKGLVGATVSIKIRRSDFSTCSRRRRIHPPTAEEGVLIRVTKELLDHWLDRHPGARLRLLGVGMSGLAAASQLNLFEDDGRSLGRTVDAIRDRFGDCAVLRGRSLEPD